MPSKIVVKRSLRFAEAGRERIECYLITGLERYTYIANENTVAPFENPIRYSYKIGSEGPLLARTADVPARRRQKSFTEVNYPKNARINFISDFHYWSRFTRGARDSSSLLCLL